MCEIFIDILKCVRVGLYVSEYIYKIKVGYNRCSYLTYLKLYMKAQLISSPICQIDTNLLFSINYCIHEYSSFLGETWWLKLLPTEILSSLKFPPPPALNVHETFESGFIPVLAVLQSFAPLDKGCKRLPLWTIQAFKLSLYSLHSEENRSKVVLIYIWASPKCSELILIWFLLLNPPKELGLNNLGGDTGC